MCAVAVDTSKARLNFPGYNTHVEIDPNTTIRDFCYYEIPQTVGNHRFITLKYNEKILKPDEKILVTREKNVHNFKKIKDIAKCWEEMKYEVSKEAENKQSPVKLKCDNKKLYLLHKG